MATLFLKEPFAAAFGKNQWGRVKSVTHSFLEATMWTGTGTLSFHPLGYHPKSNGLLLLLVSIALTHVETDARHVLQCLRFWFTPPSDDLLWWAIDGAIGSGTQTTGSPLGAVPDSWDWVPNNVRNKFATGGSSQVSEILKNNRWHSILVGGNAKDSLSSHGTAWLMSFPVASCSSILLGSGSLSPVIAIGRLDIQRSLANKLYTTEAQWSCNTSYAFGRVTW